MMMENKKTVFENWLNEYGSHLEQLAAARLSGGSEQGAPSPDRADSSRASNDIAGQGH